ncbi:ankyrin repeat domain-containing protein [Aestuariivirga sp.]|uniref:ankyrin repeat domain-containing protein n=1 Tax=Aestuariivirga sp. TaxID=2650926 RepID=UPI00391C32D1
MEDAEERRRLNHLFAEIDTGFREGDAARLAAALGGSPRWFDEPMPHELGLGHPLEYAIYWSPVSFIEALISLGSSPNYVDDAGFPSLLATLSTTRVDRLAILELLLAHGADPNQRGINDWTPLHWAAGHGDGDAVKLLLKHGADPGQRTRIDYYETPEEEAWRAGFGAVADLLRRHGKP